jgi:hypothetical protein
MTLSAETENVLNYLEGASSDGLRKRNDMGTILELAARQDADEDMNALIFNGRHLYSLYKTLRKTGPGAEGYRTLEKEFATAIETVREILARVLLEAGEEEIARFNTHYYAATHGSLRNLVDLAHDLGVLKGVQNDEKYRTDEE